MCWRSDGSSCDNRRQRPEIRGVNGVYRAFTSEPAPLPANTELCGVLWREPGGTLIPLPGLGGGRVRLIFRGKKPGSGAGLPMMDASQESAAFYCGVTRLVAHWHISRVSPGQTLLDHTSGMRWTRISELG